MKINATPKRIAAIASVVILSASSLSACIPLIAGGVVTGTVLSVTDRRTTGIQVVDKTTASRVSSAIRNVYGTRTHVNVNVYNQRVLLTGEAPDEATKADVEQIVSKVDDVRYIVNELAIMPPTSTTSRANDALLTGKVKAAFVDEEKLAANAFLITTERGIVYLMGRVTEREAKIAAEVTSRVSGVQKVVKVMEFITDAELAEFNKKYGPKESVQTDK